MNLNKKQNEVLIGIILGDGYLQKTGKLNSRLRLEHGFQQKDYLQWKVDFLRPLFNGEPKLLRRIHPLSKKTYSYCRHQSNSSRVLGKLREIFYQDGVKKIPDNLEKILVSPLSLAVWFMDDGYFYKRDKCGYLYLGNITLDEAKIVKKTFFNNFVLETKVLSKKKGFAICFSPKEMKKLANIIKPYLLDIFYYKIPS